ncbi:unnamed protein product [Adineta steineri]|uniref:F-box domain-containing protein n=1 Tax=Adineta steineri TaxID=433720 RepID=A0A814IBS1_9BILA|nr:unnamed protein product [Adineta steineri]CAF1111499.1 unnamed protein product [Adineta steineri]
MNRSNIHLLDLPDEILLIILKKLNNMDVLYSLLDINNGRLNILAQANTFTNILKLPNMFWDHSLSDRFYIDILPKIHHNVKCFIFDSDYMKRFLLATDYPNLTELKILHFNEQFALGYLISRNTVIDGTFIQHDILDYMPQLHSFTFCICTYVKAVDLSYKLSSEDIQQTLTNTKQQQVTSIVNYIQYWFDSSWMAACSIFSLPFQFDYLKHLGNKFPNIVFSYVTFLFLEDTNPFQHEFFVRISRSFPLLKYLHICNGEPQVLDDLVTCSSDNCQ